MGIVRENRGQRSTKSRSIMKKVENLARKGGGCKNKPRLRALKNRIMPRQQNVVYVRKERGEGLARGLKGPFSSSSFSPFSLIERNNGPILEGRREAEKILILVAKLLPPQHNTFPSSPLISQVEINSMLHLDYVKVLKLENPANIPDAFFPPDLCFNTAKSFWVSESR